MHDAVKAAARTTLVAEGEDDVSWVQERLTRIESQLAEVADVINLREALKRVWSSRAEAAGSSGAPQPAEENRSQS